MKKTKRKCVYCGSVKNKGGWISENVYDYVVGKKLGVKCGIEKCKIKKGTPADHKFYWYKHFLLVALQPDYFSEYAYNNFWTEINIEDPKIEKRIKELRIMIKKKWGGERSQIK